MTQIKTLTIRDPRIERGVSMNFNDLPYIPVDPLQAPWTGSLFCIIHWEYHSCNILYIEQFVNVSWRMLVTINAANFSYESWKPSVLSFFCMYAKQFFLVKESFRHFFRKSWISRSPFSFSSSISKIRHYSQSHMLKYCDIMVVTRRYNRSCYDTIAIARIPK